MLVGDDVIVHCAELHDESAVHVNELSFISICERKQSPFILLMLLLHKCVIHD